MYEPKEVVNMIATIAFFLYFLWLYKRGRCSHIPIVWLLGVLLITVSNIATVVEGFWLNALFNLIEHSSFTMACVFFLVGSFQIKMEVRLNK